jgi:hypothetical protein
MTDFTYKPNVENILKELIALERPLRQPGDIDFAQLAGEIGIGVNSVSRRAKSGYYGDQFDTVMVFDPIVRRSRWVLRRKSNKA